MFCRLFFRVAPVCLFIPLSLPAAPVIDPIPNANIPAGKSLIVPVTATSTDGRPLTFTATSSTSAIIVLVQTNEPFWKMSVVQAATSNAPGAFQIPFRGSVVTVTNIGDMTFMLFRDIAPHTVDVIQGLTQSGFYTSNTIFHRAVPGFVIQGGDPNTNGTGGPVFRYDDELNPTAIFTGNGQLAMAHSAGQDTNGSQFFVTSGPQRFLDFKYTLFGQLLRGFNVLTNIINTPTNDAARPLADVIITKASFVPDTSDTVLTLLATNIAGVTGTISVIGDDGAGGRATNTFTATSFTDTNSNGEPFMHGNTMTNLVAPVNVPLTNVLNAVGLDSQTLFWSVQFADQPSFNGASNSTYNIANSVFKMLTYNVTNAQGQVQLSVKPSMNYTGPVNLKFYVSSYPGIPPDFSDYQEYTFVFGDTPISAQGTNFTAYALKPFTNQLLATFTNGVPNSPANNFTAFINWGDNFTNSGVIVNGLNSRKNVLGSHTYTNAGNYPIYLIIQNTVGASATVVSTANVPPTLSLTRTGIQNVVSWPAWATDYQLQRSVYLSSATWSGVSKFPTLVGYQIVVTNNSPANTLFFRLQQ